ncbi:MAG: SMP-30/gluconolactonase/LRE family protein [Thiohalocapsa sp.]|nr:SMP-30/gluconolactonase/LRE family protein [Thiohalocapsa sp.]
MPPLDDIPQPVTATRARLGEGPCWIAEEACLYWVDIYNHRVHRYDPATRAERWFDVGDAVGCLAPAGDHRLLLALRHRLAFLDTATGALTPLPAFEHRAHIRCNDGKCDARGRFWVGTMSTAGADASLYRYTADGTLAEMETGLTVSNGLGWSPDGGTFYLTDSPAQVIYAYDFEPGGGTLANRRVLVDLRGEAFFPDGLAIDRDGCLWSAMWDGWCVIRFAPDGRELLRVPMPVQRPTCCAFGGPDLSTLFVTSASVGLSEAEIERSFHAGDLFAVRPGVSGFSADAFGGGAAASRVAARLA